MLKLNLRRPGRPSPALVVAIIACVIATTGVAISAPNGPDGVVHACYNKGSYDSEGSSTIVVVPSADKCNSDYPDHFTFNASGPAGPVGAAGAPGATGATGASGAKPITAKEVASLKDQQKDLLAAEKKTDKELKEYQQADTSKEQQQAMEDLLKKMLAFIKEIQDQQAQQVKVLTKVR